MLKRCLTMISGALLLTAATCERPVDLDLEQPSPRLVIISNFTVGQEVTVLVSRSRSVLLQDDPEYLRGAVVEIYEDEAFLETLKLIEPGEKPPFYATTTTQTEAGKTYTLTVAAPGFDQVSATSVIPAPIPIQSLEAADLTSRQVPETGQQEISYRVELGFQDPPGQSNYYQLRFYQQILEYHNAEGDTIITGGFLRPIEFNTAGDNNTMTTYFDGGILFEDTGFDGRPATYSFRLNTTIFPETQLLGKLYAELWAVSEEYYHFHRSLSRQQNSSGSPFSEPVIIFNNVENGAGVFAGYHISRDSVSFLPE